MVRYFNLHVTESRQIPRWVDYIIATASTEDVIMDLPKINKKLHGKILSVARTDLLDSVTVAIQAAEGDTIMGTPRRIFFGGRLSSAQFLADNDLKMWHELS